MAQHGTTRKGEVDHSVVEAMLAWTAEHEIPLRGHNVYWGVPDMVQPWLKQLDDAALRETLKARGFGVAGGYRGRLAEYDLNNGMCTAVPTDHGWGPGSRWGWQLDAPGDPQAVLYLNDYDVLTGRRLDDYVAQIRKFLDRVCRLAASGCRDVCPGTLSMPRCSRTRWMVWPYSSCLCGSRSSISRSTLEIL